MGCLEDKYMRYELWYHDDILSLTFREIYIYRLSIREYLVLDPRYLDDSILRCNDVKYPMRE